MSKKLISLLLAVGLLLAALAAVPAWTAAAPPPEDPESGESAQVMPYADVPGDIWYAPYVLAMYGLGVFPEGELFRPDDTVTRMELVSGLYRLHLALGGEPGDPEEQMFTDVPAGTEDCAAAGWAGTCGVTRGTGEGAFSPETPVTREIGCGFAIQFAAAKDILLPKVCEPSLFPDSDTVLPYTRSAMAACQAAGIVTGQSDGLLNPGGELSRAGTAAILCRLWEAIVRERAPEEEYVSTSPDAYLYLYEKPGYDFSKPIPESEAVPLEWLRDAVFVGDSLTVGLKAYNKGALGDAMFLCSQSLSAPSAMAAVTKKSLHPKWNGTKMKIEDAVAACGAKYVYIMLGINNMYSAVETSTASMVKFIGLIQEKSPDVAIIVQSVTPLSASSTCIAKGLSNAKIDRYNAVMQQYCAENGWYYLDIASAVKDEDGNFNVKYCSDPKGMGIHFSVSGAAVWSEYIRTHVPEELK